jgi:oligosaccharide reducing-end xylanase
MPAPEPTLCSDNATAQPAVNRRLVLGLAAGSLVGCTMPQTQLQLQPQLRPQPMRNLFASLLGKTEQELDAKLAAAWQHFFAGDAAQQRIYFESVNGMAYIADIGSNDVRSEGMSYGMLIAVQLNRKAEFDRLWKWANTYMRHTAGERKGYFAWSCTYEGKQNDPGSASDGEAWFAMALLMAAQRWGSDAHADPLLHYNAQAQILLHDMLHKPSTANVTAIYNRQERQIVFAPSPAAAALTDPSYHLPAFTEIWAHQAATAQDRTFWRDVTDTSRAFFKRAAHPQTGLMPEYAHFNGQPFTSTQFGPGKGDFRYDAWRTLANVGMDYAWWRADEWQVAQSNRVLRFLSTQNEGPQAHPASNYALDGKPLLDGLSLGLIACAAVAGHAADAAIAKPWVQRLWDAPLPTGQWRYYDGILYCLALLQAGGRFRPWVG